MMEPAPELPIGAPTRVNAVAALRREYRVPGLGRYRVLTACSGSWFCGSLSGGSRVVRSAWWAGEVLHV